MVERVNKLLKDDFGCNTIYYQGAIKVASVLAFGILSICIDQSLKLVTWQETKQVPKKRKFKSSNHKARSENGKFIEI